MLNSLSCFHIRTESGPDSLDIILNFLFTHVAQNLSLFLSGTSSPVENTLIDLAVRGGNCVKCADGAGLV